MSATVEGKLISFGKSFNFWFFPIIFSLLIVPQAALSALFLGDYLAFIILLSSILAIVFYVFGGLASLNLSSGRVVYLRGFRKKIFYWVFLIFFGSYIVLFWDYGGVPLIDVLLGQGEASVSRASFYKGVEGVGGVFVYVRSILIRGFLPFAIIIAYCSFRRFNFIVLLMFASFLLISSLEKSLLLWAYGPLLIFCFFYGDRRDFYKFMLMAAIIFSFVSVVALDTPGKLAKTEQFESQFDQWNYSYAVCKEDCLGLNRYVDLNDRDNYRFILHDLRDGGISSYLLNRIFWIPFVTIYDTLYFWALNYNDHIGFSVNRHISNLLGYEFADLERKVFRFQFGSGEDSTGNANAAYIAEAYVGFGFLGVICISFVIGLGAGWIVKASMPQFVCALPMLGFGLVSASFISLFFSGGMLAFLMFFVIFSKPKRMDKCR